MKPIDNIMHKPIVAMPQNKKQNQNCSHIICPLAMCFSALHFCFFPLQIVMWKAIFIHIFPSQQSLSYFSKKSTQYILEIVEFISSEKAYTEHHIGYNPSNCSFEEKSPDGIWEPAGKHQRNPNRNNQYTKILNILFKVLRH